MQFVRKSNLLPPDKSWIPDRCNLLFVVGKRRCSPVVPMMERIFDDALQFSILTMNVSYSQLPAFWQYRTFYQVLMLRATAKNIRLREHLHRISR